MPRTCAARSSSHEMSGITRSTPSISCSGQQTRERVTAQDENQIGTEHLDLLVEEVAARVHLGLLRVAIARRPALDDVGDVDVAPVETHRFEQAREQLPGRSHEGLALA